MFSIQKKYIRTFLVSALLLTVGWMPGVLQASSSGKIVGRVVDNSKTSDNGIMNANIVVLDLDSSIVTGGATDLDGFYQILNIPVGIYSVVISHLEFHTITVENVNINIDYTTDLKVMELTPITIERPEVIIIYVPPQVELGTTASIRRIDKGTLNILIPTSAESITAISPGIKIDPEGKLHSRGGRGDDIAIIVEGVDERDPFVDTRFNMAISSANIDEISVITGGFNAEYGRVMSGLILITTAEGAPGSYTGRLEYQTDRLIDTYSFDTDRVELSVGGPVPYSKKLLGSSRPVTFFFSGITTLNNTYTPFNINRPSSDYLGIGLKLPERQSNDYQASLKLAYKLTDKKKLTLYTKSTFSQWDLYPYGEGGKDGNYGYGYKYNTELRPWALNRSFTGTLTYTNQPTSKTFYELKVSTYITHSKVQPRGKNPGEFTLRADIEDDFAVASDRNMNGRYDSDEYADSDGDGFMDGYVDANDNGIFDGGGEGYEDLNFNGRWDRGEDWVDLNGNGIYDAAEPWTDVANPLSGENNIGVYDPWDNFTDLNGNGRWDPAEPQLPEQDWNGNGRWDGERFIDANRDGDYNPWEPWTDVNGNFRWDEGEPYFDTNGNGRFDYSEGYDDKNDNGRIDKRDLRRTGNDIIDFDEPYIDGDYYFDTGEPFIDEPDPITGEYNGRWDDGEIWFDLPSSANQQTGAGVWRLGSEMTLNGEYDGPNEMFDEYELFTYPANWSFNSDRSRPILFTFNEEARGTDWPPIPFIYMWIEGKSTWINRTIHDGDNPVFNLANGNADVSQEAFIDYNQNGKWDRADRFLNPGQWDTEAFWQDRTGIDYSIKFDIQSQVSRFHEIKSGVEMIYRDLEMMSMQAPDLPYSGEAVLPSGSPWPDRGDIRDFYRYKPVEGSVYVQDKMEFEGLIVNAGIRADFLIHDGKIIDDFTQKLEDDEPGALVAERGKWKISPRLGISHPITERSKLYFNYGHFYQAPKFTYFYKSATANVNTNTAIGNPNLEYEKTIQYELGVNTQISDYVVIDISGYYKDQYDLISTDQEKWKNLTLDRYVNLDYGRMRGFELSIEKRPADHYTFEFSYDFSYAMGKSSEQHANVGIRDIPVNFDEYPLDWDETHRINAHVNVLYGRGEHPRFWGMVLPDDWMATLQWEFGSGRPYKPSKYTTGIDNTNLILANSARLPWHELTTLKFEKYYTLTSSENKPGSRLLLGMTVNNVFNKRNVQTVYPETGNPTQAIHPLNPSYNPGDNRQEYDNNPRHFSSGRNILFRIGWTF